MRNDGRQDASGELEFGKYRLIREIGRGGMGVVFLARQIDLDRTVAIKMILASHLATGDEIRRFYAEARAAGRVRHANVVGIHEVGEIRGQHYFAMDHVEGRSLAEVASKTHMAPEAAAKLLADVARAVQCLHDHNIVHRDLKPSNILLDDQGKPYVTDFGLAKVYDTDSPQTRSGAIIGTPSYMSPEQAAGHSAAVLPATDVYSLGAILYELLTGRPPFRRETPHETLLEVLEGEATWPVHLNAQLAPELALICMRCLEKQPEARYASAAALADDLERYLKGDAIEARPSNWLQRIRRWGRRQPALVSHLCGLAAAATILQLMFFDYGADVAYHIRVMSIFGAWGIVSVVFQLLLMTGAADYPVRFAWSASDVLFLTTLLFMADGPIGALLIGYPFLIAASGLFFRVRLVLFTTLVSLMSYAVLVVLRPDEAVPYQYPVLFSATLAVLGFVVAHQVYRIRALSRYYEHRRLP
jgi:serine/threonine-protein kinase